MGKFNIKVGDRIRVLSHGRTADRGSILEITRIEPDGAHEVKLISGSTDQDYLETFYFATHRRDGSVFAQEEWEFVEKEEKTMGQTKFKVGQHVIDSEGSRGVVAEVPEVYKGESWATNENKVWAYWNGMNSPTWNFINCVFPIDYPPAVEKITPSVDGVKYKHIRPDYANAKTGGITIAYRLVEGKRGGRELHYGIAYCNKNDQFNKTIGREIALKQMLDRPNVLQYDPLVANLFPGYNKVRPMDVINWMFVSAIDLKQLDSV